MFVDTRTKIKTLNFQGRETRASINAARKTDLALRIAYLSIGIRLFASDIRPVMRI